MLKKIEFQTQDIEIDKLVGFRNYSMENFKGFRLEEAICQIIGPTYFSQLFPIDTEPSTPDSNTAQKKEESSNKDYFPYPVTVRPTGNGTYEILNQQYLVAAAKKLNRLHLFDFDIKIETIPCIVREDLSDEAALKELPDLTPDGLLMKHHIDIFQPDFRSSEGYQSLKEFPIQICDEIGTVMRTLSLEDYILKYLLDSQESIKYFESKYSMGTTIKLEKEDCDYTNIVAEILRNTKDSDKSDEAKTLAEMLEWGKTSHGINQDVIQEDINQSSKTIFYHRVDRNHGVISQYKKYLKIDLDSFDDETYIDDKIKMIIFPFYLKHKFSQLKEEYPQPPKVLSILSKPSLESLDRSSYGWETTNGSITKFVKTTIEKECTPELIHNLNNLVKITNQLFQSFIWISNYYASSHFGSCIYFLDKNELEINIRLLQDALILTNEEIDVSAKSSISPIGMFYFRIVQFENLSYLQDLLHVLELLTKKTKTIIPRNKPEEMRQLNGRLIKIDEIDKFFQMENINRIAKYIFPNKVINKDDRKKILHAKDKVLKILNFPFLKLAETMEPGILNFPFLNVTKGVFTELFLISCLQCILLEPAHEFDYSYPRKEGMPGKRQGKKLVMAALKNTKCVIDALQLYWIYMIREYYFANLDDRLDVLLIENYEIQCLNNWIRVYQSNSISEMEALINYYQTHSLLEQEDYIAIPIEDVSESLDSPEK